MQISDWHVDLRRQSRRIVIQQFLESLYFPNVLAEHRDVVILRHLPQLADRLLRFSLEALDRSERQVEVWHISTCHEARRCAAGLTELAEFDTVKTPGVSQQCRQRIDSLRFRQAIEIT